MRTHAALRILPLLLVLTSPLLLRAQFQAPTPEELKMTDDPKAPGAAAVYLNIAEDCEASKGWINYYARIKVLQEKGKELATVEIPYVRDITQVEFIQARTIHSDGTIIPLTGKPADLLVDKLRTKQGYDFQINQKVFNLPSVEVGSILEYSFRLFGANVPTWKIQRRYFVHHERFFYRSFDMSGAYMASLLWLSSLPVNKPIQPDISNAFHLELDDIPAAPDEEFMPPIDSLLYRVQFYYKEASSAGNFWVDAAKLWSKDVDRFAEPSKTLKEAVAALVAPTDSDLDKARKIYLAVQALDNTDFSRAKSDAERKRLNLKDTRHAQDIWEQKSGSSNEIALLYLAMLRAAGLTAYAESVVDRQQGVFDQTYLSLSQLDDVLVVLSAGGKEIELDPGEKMCPFQTVSWRHSAAGGISQTASGANTVTSANQIYSANKITRFGDITLDDHGGVSGGFKVAMIGQEALYWRQLALRNDEDEVKKRFDQSLQSIVPDGIEAHIDHFAGLDDPNANLIAVVKAQGSMGVATSKRVILPAFFFETRAKHPFVAEEKRQTKVDMHYGETILEQMTYHLPAGLSVEGAPADANESWPQHAIFNTKATVAPGQVTVVRKFYRNFTFAQPEEYQELRGFYQKVATADQGEVVLTTAPVTPKGN
ncbi:MAG: DUF3857 and transglutaminase domain-containing protein [Terracidiphilus sp.]